MGSFQLIGMIHLGPLPGSPRYTGTFDATLERAIEDATTLTKAGFDALMIENYGDTPFYPDEVPSITVAAMARAVATVRAATEVPLGVNVLRNDAKAALSIAAACSAQFIRVNVLSGSMYTDQGLIEGKAADVARLRMALDPDIEVLADVFVKHATPPAGLTIQDAASDLWHRGMADALIVSGPATGRPPTDKTIAQVRAGVPDAPLLIGSGATKGRLAQLVTQVDGVIVGTDIKHKGDVGELVDPKRAGAFVRTARKTAS